MKGNNICFAKRAAWGAVKCIFYNACNQQAKYRDVLGRQTKYQIPGESLYKCVKTKRNDFFTTIYICPSQIAMALQSVTRCISVTLTFGCFVNVAASGTSDAIYSVMHENSFLPLCCQVVLTADKEFLNQTSFFFSTKKKNQGRVSGSVR